MEWLDTIPIKMRKYWRAQKGICPYCGNRLSVSRKQTHMTTWDHVTPKSNGGVGPQNKVLAHARCNWRKGFRLPTPCEVLFLDSVNLIIFKNKREEK